MSSKYSRLRTREAQQRLIESVRRDVMTELLNITKRKINYNKLQTRLNQIRSTAKYNALSKTNQSNMEHLIEGYISCFGFANEFIVLTYCKDGFWKNLDPNSNEYAPFKVHGILGSLSCTAHRDLNVNGHWDVYMWYNTGKSILVANQTDVDDFITIDPLTPYYYHTKDCEYVGTV